MSLCGPAIPDGRPGVTVILSTYNRSDMLRWAVASLLHQTRSDLELLVIGDHCTDDGQRPVSPPAGPRIESVPIAAKF